MVGARRLPVTAAVSMPVHAAEALSTDPRSAGVQRPAFPGLSRAPTPERGIDRHLQPAREELEAGAALRRVHRPVGIEPPNYQEALLPCADPHAITRSGTLFDQTIPVIDKRMTSELGLRTYRRRVSAPTSNGLVRRAAGSRSAEAEG